MIVPLQRSGKKWRWPLTLHAAPWWWRIDPWATPLHFPVMRSPEWSLTTALKYHWLEAMSHCLRHGSSHVSHIGLGTHDISLDLQIPFPRPKAKHSMHIPLTAHYNRHYTHLRRHRNRESLTNSDQNRIIEGKIYNVYLGIRQYI